MDAAEADKLQRLLALFARDLYADLGASRTASADELRQVFRQRVQELHPDRTGDHSDEARERFTRLTEAWSVLRDEELRSMYDARLQAEDAVFGRKRGPTLADLPSVEQRFRDLWGPPLQTFDEFKRAERRRRK